MGLNWQEYKKSEEKTPDKYIGMNERKMLGETKFRKPKKKKKKRKERKKECMKKMKINLKGKI